MSEGGRQLAQTLGESEIAPVDWTNVG
jgi:hypothetical protein